MRFYAKKNFEVKHGNSIGNLIIIDATNSILGVIGEHDYIEQLYGGNVKGFKSLQQNCIKENKNIYDQFVIKMMDETEKVLYFDITSFFEKI